MTNKAWICKSGFGEYRSAGPSLRLFDFFQKLTSRVDQNRLLSMVINICSFLIFEKKKSPSSVLKSLEYSILYSQWIINLYAYQKYWSNTLYMILQIDEPLTKVLLAFHPWHECLEVLSAKIRYQGVKNMNDSIWINPVQETLLKKSIFLKNICPFLPYSISLKNDENSHSGIPHFLGGKCQKLA